MATPLLLAGLLPMPVEVSSRWGWSGCWVHPVGDPYLGPGLEPNEYREMRGVSEATAHDRGHQGADLSNGRGGGPVRAAGNGLVVKAGGKGWNRGYGRHVVLAHQMTDGLLVYSVYAHLAPGSITVKRGDYVPAGRVIGRVGMTGRATSPHLHFEVRVPEDPLTRWENARAIDPMAFVATRLPTARADSSWADRYLEWAECAALIRPGDRGELRPTRAEWWRALLLATRHRLATVPLGADSLRSALVGIRLLAEDSRTKADAPLPWSEVTRDIRRAHTLGLRLPRSPVPGRERARTCREHFGTRTPAGAPDTLARGREGGPTRAEMCLVLADLAGDPPRPKRPKTPKPRPKRTPAG
jgi:hypothetical protein